MKLELNQEGAPKLGDTLIYCGENTWCWQKPVTTRDTTTIVERTPVSVVVANNAVSWGAFILAAIALCLSLLSLARKYHQR